MPALAQNRLISLSKRSASRRGLPASMLYAMMLQESGGDPEKVGDKGKALGLMQVHPDAAKEQGYRHEDMTDPDKAVDAGAGYVAKMLRRLQDPGRALSAYNAGPGRTRQSEDLAPSAVPYVEDVATRVRDLTQPGQPFEEEANVGALPLPMQTLKAQKIQKHIDELLGRIPKQHPPMLMDEKAPFDENGIRGMLSTVFK